MCEEARIPEASKRGEVAVASASLRDALTSNRASQKRMRWALLIPGSAVVLYFVGTAFVAVSPEPAVTLAVMFGGGLAFGWRRYSRLGSEERCLEERLRNVENFRLRRAPGNDAWRWGKEHRCPRLF